MLLSMKLIIMSIFESLQELRKRGGNIKAFWQLKHFAIDEEINKRVIKMLFYLLFTLCMLLIVFSN